MGPFNVKIWCCCVLSNKISIDLVINRSIVAFYWQTRVLNTSMFNGLKGNHRFYLVFMTESDEMGPSNGNNRWKTFLRKVHQISIQVVNSLLLLTKKGIKPMYVQCNNRIPSFKVSVYDIKGRNRTIQCKNMMLLCFFQQNIHWSSNQPVNCSLLLTNKGVKHIYV